MSIEPAFDDADLNGFVDGRIEPARAAALAESLASDPEARARVDGWKRQNESLRTMFASVLFEPVPVRLLPGALPLQEAAASAPRSAEGGAVRAPGRLAGVVAMTSIGMALVGFALGALASIETGGFGFGLAPAASHGSAAAENRSDTGAGESGSLAERAAEAHRTFLGDTSRPVEMTAAEEPKLLRWLQHRLGATLRIPDFARQGWTFVGGRIVPGRHGPAAFLIYGNGSDRLALTMTRAAGSTQGHVGTVGDGALTLGVATWGDADFGYALTSDHGADWLEHNAGALRSAMRDGEPPP